MRALRVLMTNIRQPRRKANTVYLSKCTWWCSLNTSPSQNYHRFQPKTVSSYHLSKNKKGTYSRRLRRHYREVSSTNISKVSQSPYQERKMKTNYCWLSTVFFKPMTLRHSAGSPSPVIPHLHLRHSLIHCWERAQRTKCLLEGTARRQGQEHLQTGMLFLPATSLHNTWGNN